MDVGVVVNAVVVTAVGLILGWFGKGRFEASDRRIDRLGERLERRIDALDRRMDMFQSSMDVLRSDLTQVALAVGARPRATNA
jgi:hypothetical protein